MSQISVALDGEARRDTIIRAAVTTMAERGYGGASLRVVAEAAGIEKGHLTYYFRAKDDLLFTIVNELHEQYVVGLAAWVNRGPEEPLERLRHVLQRHLELLFQVHIEARVAYESSRFLTQERRSLVVAKRHWYENRIGELIDEARVTGAIAEVPTKILTNAVLGVINWPYQWFDPEGPVPPSDLAEMLAGRAFSTLLA